ncbi:MAG: alpha/beta fold hydrolase [Bacteroidota bacterium]
MPIITSSNYQATGIFKNGHLNTIFPTLFRRIKEVHYKRERVELPDGDFIDLDWSRQSNRQLVLVLHGLEGSSDSVYIRGMIRAFNRAGWDGVAMNFRSCSGDPNRKLKSYNMGASDDLKLIINHLKESTTYKKLVLIGSSLGGNVILKYLGEEGENAPNFIDRAITFSVPCDIPSTNEQLKKWYNQIYLKRFLKTLNDKFQEKLTQFPNQIQFSGRRFRTFQDFDDNYTAPVHGYKNADEYWHRCSSKHFVSNIRVPTLLINALDDSFLGADSYIYELAEKHPFFYLETPKHGGHVGFVDKNEEGLYWSEKRALSFVEEEVICTIAKNSEVAKP